MTRRLCQLFASLCFLGASLSAQTLYGVTGVEGAASSLYTVNIATGATTLIGPTGFSGVGSLAFAPNGTLYGVANSELRLITINTSTGVGTAVSANGTGTGNIADIAVRSDGVLFATYGAGVLYTINTTTGIATFIGGLPGGGGNALAFNAGGTLFLCSSSILYTVNQSTAATTQVAVLNNGAFQFTKGFAGMKFHPTTGVLYLTALGQLGSLSTFSGTPVVTNLGNTGVALEAIAFGNAAPAPPPSAVPGPSTLLLLGTGLSIAMGWFFLRGRHTTRG